MPLQIPDNSIDTNQIRPLAVTEPRLSRDVQQRIRWVAKSNFTAITGPSANDDINDGYEPGSLWVDTIGSACYQCSDNTEGAAVWLNIGSAATGEANTASNVGTGGVGVFKQKSGVDLQFKKINGGSSKITIIDDTTNNEVDIDVIEANFTSLVPRITSVDNIAVRFNGTQGSIQTSSIIINDAVTSSVSIETSAGLDLALSAAIGRNVQVPDRDFTAFNSSFVFGFNYYTFFVDNTFGRIGVGTNSPQTLLHMLLPAAAMVDAHLRMETGADFNFSAFSFSAGSGANKTDFLFGAFSKLLFDGFFCVDNNSFPDTIFQASSIAAGGKFWIGNTLTPPSTRFSVVTSGGFPGSGSFDDALTVNALQSSTGDFNAKGDTDANLLFVDASSDRVGIGRNNPTQKLGVEGNIALEAIGNGLHIKTGTNARTGTATLVGGTTTINNNTITSNTMLLPSLPRGTLLNIGILQESTRSVGTSITVISSNVLDTATFDYVLVERIP